ncbi:hypothetical protein Goklo_024963 [Gossypium klotzschianum]|uniref:Uncharacterized protein n=1 Tax=Gossypium klotzschianum TaxID=34286 RepID=A0A7J8W5E6_9ROSI|nr:hypothetical protein [Gossypium klotzschianum]
MDAIYGFEDSRMHPSRIFGQSQHLAHQSAIGRLCNDQLAGETRERLANIPQPHNQYIEMWQRRYDYLPTHETFLTSELATYLDYMDWFRHYKSYLLPASKKEGNVTVGGQDECPSILGRDIETQRDRHLLHLY